VLKGPGSLLPRTASAVGMAVGCFLVLFTLQVAHDLSHLLNKEFKATSGECLVVSRKASLLGTLGRFDRRFTPEEIDELSGQPFVREVGKIAMSRFRARLTGAESIPFTTELFFESAPDRFLDTVPEGWEWREGDRTIPLIVSRDFLDLYNFGFAVAYRLPQLTPHTVQSLRLSIEIGGGRESGLFQARIAGFSERFNSILVPESFLAWANGRFAAAADDGPARLVLRVDRPEHRGLAAFLEEKGYETNREKLKNSRLWNLLVILAGVGGAGGTLITILALLVTGLSFQLSMTRRDREIRLLVHLGIRPASIMNFFILRASILIAGGAGCGLIGASLASARLADLLGRYGFTVPSGLSPLLLAAAAAIAAASVACHAFMVRRHVSRLL